MSFLFVLKVIAALATAATGLLALVKPSAAYGFTGLNASGVRGVSEIRAVFGGLFIGLGLAPLFLNPAAYQMLGIGYLAIAAAGRCECRRLHVGDRDVRRVFGNPFSGQRRGE